MFQLSMLYLFNKYSDIIYGFSIHGFLQKVYTLGLGTILTSKSLSLEFRTTREESATEVFPNKEGFRVGGHCPWFDLASDGSYNKQILGSAIAYALAFLRNSLAKF